MCSEEKGEEQKKVKCGRWGSWEHDGGLPEDDMQKDINIYRMKTCEYNMMVIGKNKRRQGRK